MKNWNLYLVFFISEVYATSLENTIAHFALRRKTANWFQIGYTYTYFHKVYYIAVMVYLGYVTKNNA